jgi:hypothetical protein
LDHWLPLFFQKAFFCQAIAYTTRQTKQEAKKGNPACCDLLFLVVVTKTLVWGPQKLKIAVKYYNYVVDHQKNSIIYYHLRCLMLADSLVFLKREPQQPAQH